MNKEFIPYEQALALKELGFDENYFGCYFEKKLVMAILFKDGYKIGDGVVQAPLYQQAFRWFREKYGLYYYITTHDSTDFEWYIYDKDQNDWEDDTTQNTYEEAELACLIKLIEIANKIKYSSSDVPTYYN